MKGAVVMLFTGLTFKKETPIVVRKVRVERRRRRRYGSERDVVVRLGWYMGGGGRRNYELK
jgi:hypothetical protein